MFLLHWIAKILCAKRRHTALINRVKVYW